MVKSADGKIRLLKLIKPVKQAAATMAYPMSGEGLDLDDAEEQQGDSHVHSHIHI